MERRVKERLVGASILVALVVLIVPELLSGPKPAALPPPLLPAAAGAPEAVRNVTVDLATSKPPQANDVETPLPPVPLVVEAAAPVSRPSSGAAPPTQVAPSQGAPNQGAPAPISPPQAPSTQTAAPDTHRDWAVQLGSFASRVNSDKLVHQLKAQGFPVFELSGGTAHAPRYRVRIGPLPDRSAAERTMAKLKALGHASSIIAPGH